MVEEIKATKKDKEAFKVITDEEQPKTLNLKYQKEKDRELVKGIFKFYEIPGGQLDFVYKKYKNEPVEQYSLVDGQVYDLPLGVAKHLNKTGWVPVHVYSVDDKGVPLQKIGTKERRYLFQSLEFMDIDDLSTTANKIITVENV